MDLTYTPEQDAFRAEARAWLEANVPAEPLASFDTEAGFALHREWERRLYDARLLLLVSRTLNSSFRATVDCGLAVTSERN